MPIMTDDPQALEKLNKKLNALTMYQETMKAVNTVIRSSKSEEAKIEFIMQKCSYSRNEAYQMLHPRESWQEVGFPSYRLTNNSAEIRRLKQRIAAVSKYQKEVETVEANGELPEVPFPGGKIVDNAPENRLQIFFDGKPEKEIRDKLKQRGFRWAPSCGAWQSFRHPYTLEWAKQEFNAETNQEQTA